MSAREDFHELQLKFTDPIQQSYEIIRPIMLFDESVAERSRQLDIERTVISEKARRFIEQGMLGLIDQRTQHSGRKGHIFPEPVADYILYLKQVYPSIHDRKIVRIIKRLFAYHTNHHTVRHFLNTHPVPEQLTLDLNIPAFHEFEDGYQARYTVVTMYFAGWNKESIAGALQFSRQHVQHAIITTYKREGFAGLEDKRTRPPNHPANQLTPPLLKEILDLQHEFPRLDRFRMQGLLEQRLETESPSEPTIGRALALNRQFHGAPGPWQSAQVDQEPESVLKHLPYRPQYRHQMWFIDIRHLVRLEDG